MIKIIKKFLDFCNPENRKKFVTAIWLTVVSAIFEACKISAIFFMLKDVLNQQVTSRSIWTSLLIMLVSVVGAGLTKNKSTILQTEGGYGTCADKRMEIAEHLRYVPMGYFNDNSMGKIISVTTNTLQSLENMATRVVMMISSTLLNTLLVTLMLLVFDWRIGTVLIVGLMVFFMINDVILKESMKMAPKKDVSDAVLVEQILEYLQGITEVKSYRLTGKQCKNLNKANDKNVAINLAMEKKYVPLIGIQTLVIKLIGVAMSVVSIGFYLQGSMSLLICIVMIVASFIVYGSLESASGYTAILRSVDIAVEKANAILKTPQMDVDGADLQPKTYEIRVENISFSYDSKKIIDNVSFTIPEKSTLAIVGPSGGGKTTLTSLISRFWDVDSGAVYLDGKNVKDYSYDSLMRNFSFVFQNVYLFQDTIANNIRFGTPEVGMDEVIAAAKKACCHEFIQKLPKGYDTVIGEDGVNLSGGERQRLSIARAIMKDAPIIILDEATANVDPENETDLMNAVEELTKEKTIIMIAHRLKTVRKADQILVIEKGRIAEQGTHDVLLQKNGIYSSFICRRKEAVSWKVKMHS